MATAIARISNLTQDAEGRPGIMLQIRVNSPEIGGLLDGEVFVPSDGTESAVQLRSAMSAAVAAWPASQGYAFSIPSTSMNLPTFQKG